MYKKILIPLDGSELAECAIPYAEELANGCGTQEIILVSSTEKIKGKTKAPEIREMYNHGDRFGFIGAGSEVIITFGKQEREAKSYLTKVAKRLEKKGFKVKTEVLYWPPAEAISSFAERSEIDIIVMSSHGRSGPTKWAHGNVADKMIRATCVPVLMVKAPGCIPGF
jgi:nucleotide-binding universal stress UspA family protein